MKGTREARREILLVVCDWAMHPEKVSSESLSEFPAEIRPMKVKCIGGVDPVLLMESFLEGVDGIFLVGCKEGDCHFMEGNLQGEHKIRLIEKLLGLAGLEPRRLGYELMSALDEDLFKDSLTDFIGRAEALGDNPFSAEQTDPELLDSSLAAKAVLEGFRARALVGMELELLEKGNVYGERVSRLRFGEVQDEALRAEFFRSWIYLLLRKGPLSVQELSERTGLREGQVLRHIVAMRQRNLVSMERIDGVTPLYRALEALR
ncbi:MAG: hydrogenase iron-sulfur subunit [Candidatus Bathyarchaeota archaeon]|nr:MAG: hydrogenase iron-sulfur subunit [Candidatus Bathyarchaeota archaeon]